MVKLSIAYGRLTVDEIEVFPLPDVAEADGIGLLPEHLSTEDKILVAEEIARQWTGVAMRLKNHMPSLHSELAAVLARYNCGQDIETDFILAGYLLDCLLALKSTLSLAESTKKAYLELKKIK